MARSHLILLTLLAVLMPAAYSQATLGLPVSVKMIEDFQPAAKGEPWTNTLQISVGSTGVIDDLTAYGSGWQVDLSAWGIPMPVFPEDPLVIPFEAIGDRPDEPLEIRFTFEGKEVLTTLELGEVAYRKWALPQLTVAVDGPILENTYQDAGFREPKPSLDDGLAARDVHPSLQTVFDESSDLPKPGEPREKASRNITVSGRVVYFAEWVLGRRGWSAGQGDG